MNRRKSIKILLGMLGLSIIPSKIYGDAPKELTLEQCLEKGGYYENKTFYVSKTIFLSQVQKTIFKSCKFIHTKNNKIIFELLPNQKLNIEIYDSIVYQNIEEYKRGIK